MERESQEALAFKMKQKELTESWNQQLLGKSLLEHEIQRITNEDRLEMEKLKEQLRREEIEGEYYTQKTFLMLNYD